MCILIGSCVKWHDMAIEDFAPQEREAQANRIWTVADYIGEDAVLIVDEYGEAEVPISELELL